MSQMVCQQESLQTSPAEMKREHECQKISKT